MRYRFKYPLGFDALSVAVRARMVARAICLIPRPDRRLAALLAELADEVELGQRTNLTSKSWNEA